MSTTKALQELIHFVKISRYANKGDLLIYGDDEHVVIADGAGGCFGNSSSRGYAMKYGNANFAWHNDEAPSKIIRMGAK